jgi:hypothetical protein
MTRWCQSRDLMQNSFARLNPDAIRSFDVLWRESIGVDEPTKAMTRVSRRAVDSAEKLFAFVFHSSARRLLIVQSNAAPLDRRRRVD